MTMTNDNDNQGFELLKRVWNRYLRQFQNICFMALNKVHALLIHPIISYLTIVYKDRRFVIHLRSLIKEFVGLWACYCLICKVSNW
jgi:hypothetical protein